MNGTLKQLKDRKYKKKNMTKKSNKLLECKNSSLIN